MPGVNPLETPVATAEEEEEHGVLLLPDADETPLALVVGWTKAEEGDAVPLLLEAQEHGVAVLLPTAEDGTTLAVGWPEGEGEEEGLAVPLVPEADETSLALALGWPEAEEHGVAVLLPTILVVLVAVLEGYTVVVVLIAVVKLVSVLVVLVVVLIVTSVLLVMVVTPRKALVTTVDEGEGLAMLLPTKDEILLVLGGGTPPLLTLV